MTKKKCSHVWRFIKEVQIPVPLTEKERQERQEQYDKAMAIMPRYTAMLKAHRDQKFYAESLSYKWGKDRKYLIDTALATLDSMYKDLRRMQKDMGVYDAMLHESARNAELIIEEKRDATKKRKGHQYHCEKCLELKEVHV